MEPIDLTETDGQLVRAIGSNMVTVPQLDRLLDVLALDENNRVLDLGCGVGTLTEYLSDMTGATFTGMDFATGAILRAQERTKEKRRRVTFLEGDLEFSFFRQVNSIPCWRSIPSISSATSRRPSEK